MSTEYEKARMEAANKEFISIDRIGNDFFLGADWGRAYGRGEATELVGALERLEMIVMYKREENIDADPMELLEAVVIISKQAIAEWRKE